MDTIADVVARSLRRCAESRARDPALPRPRPRNALGRLGVAVAATLALCAGRGDPVAPELVQHGTGFQGLTSSDKRAKRRSYNLAELQKLAVAASAFKEKCQGQGIYQWKNEFLYAEFGQWPVGPELQSMLSAAMKLPAFKTKRLAANARGTERSHTHTPIRSCQTGADGAHVMTVGFIARSWMTRCGIGSLTGWQPTRRA